MNELDLIFKRRSIRKYQERLVEEEKINKLLEAAMAAPSAVNKCPWAFYVITNKDTLNELKKVCKYAGYNAPMAIVVCGNLDKALPGKMSEYWIQDTSAATENILLAAVAMGLGTVWCGVYPQEKVTSGVKEVLHLSDNLIPLNIILVGYPAEEKESRTRFEEENVHWVR